MRAFNQIRVWSGILRVNVDAWANDAIRANMQNELDELNQLLETVQHLVLQGVTEGLSEFFDGLNSPFKDDPHASSVLESVRVGQKVRAYSAVLRHLTGEGKAYVDTPAGLVPEHLFGGIHRYVFERVKPGGFLDAMLVNDAKEMIYRAKGLSFDDIKTTTLFLESALSNVIWGSPKFVCDWLREKDEGRQARLGRFVDIPDDYEFKKVT